MDNSPTTGSVNTTAQEKQCLVKSSLAFDCKKYVHCSHHLFNSEDTLEGFLISLLNL